MFGCETTVALSVSSAENPRALAGCLATAAACCVEKALAFICTLGARPEDAGAVSPKLLAYGVYMRAAKTDTGAEWYA